MKKQKPGDGYYFKSVASDGCKIYILKDKRGTEINNYIVLPDGDHWKFFSCDGDPLKFNEIDPMWAVHLNHFTKIKTYNYEVADSDLHILTKDKILNRSTHDT